MNVDWLPTLNLGHCKASHRTPAKQLLMWNERAKNRRDMQQEKEELESQFLYQEAFKKVTMLILKRKDT